MARLVTLKLISELAWSSDVGKATKRPTTFYYEDKVSKTQVDATHIVPHLSARRLVDKDHPFAAPDIRGKGVTRRIVRSIGSSHGLAFELDKGVDLWKDGHPDFQKAEEWLTRSFP